MRNIKKLVFLLFGLVVVVLCLRQIREPDLWWQVATGEYILENGEVPKTDVFSFTFEGVEWINVKWGSEVLQALVVRLLGVEFLPLLQVVFSLLTIWFVYRIYKLQSLQNSSVNKQYVFIALATIALLVVAFRMNTRPEMASHLFAFLFISIYEQYRKNASKMVFLIIPLQLIWANMHEGFGMGIVISGAYVFSFLVNRFKPFDKEQLLETKQLAVLIGVVALSWLSVSIHPMGSRMILHPWNIFTQLSDNQFTTELYSWKMKEYWSFSSYLNILFFAIGGLFMLNKYKKKTLLKDFGLAYVLLFFAFFYLSISSFRNIPFFVWIAVPITSNWLLQKWASFNQARIQWSLIVVLGLVYLSVVSGTFYQTVLPREKYGLNINPAKSPVGLCNYIKKHDVKGEAFTDYIISSYMLWELRPDFKTFVDLRDLDIFNPSFISTTLRCLTDPNGLTPSGEEVWNYLDGRAKFDYAVVTTNPQFLPLLNELESGGVYTLAYEDNISRLYLRNDGANADLLKGDFKKFGSGRYLEMAKENKAATFVSKIFWPAFSR